MGYIIYFFDIVNADMVDWKRTYIVKTKFICYVLMLFLLFLNKQRKYIDKKHRSFSGSLFQNFTPWNPSHRSSPKPVSIVYDRRFNGTKLGMFDRLKRVHKYQSSECSVPSVIFFFSFCLFCSVPEGSSVIKLKEKKASLILGITRQNKVFFF